MAETLRIGDPAIEIRLRRHAQARRFVLRVSRDGQGAALTLPRGVPAASAIAFLEANEDWLRTRLMASGARVAVADGAILPFRGGALRVRRVEGRGLDFADGVLSVPGAPETVPAKVRGWLREVARQDLLARSDFHAAQLGRRFSGITLRDPRSRWGSCSADGGLMYSWRLVMAPPEVLDYVAAHEVAHLAEMNHSPRFWALVERLLPGHATPRDWLRRSGATLHLFDFGPS